MSIGAVGSPAASAFPLSPGEIGAGKKPPSPAEVAKMRAEAAQAQQKATLGEIREKGLYAWAQEQKFEALKEKIRKELMAERGIDEASLAAMPEEARRTLTTSLEEEIAKRIQEVMRDALEGEVKEAVAQGRPPQPMIIDISV